MSGVLLKVVIYVIIFSAIYFGIKRIIGDWKAKFSEMDEQKKARDQRERQRPDVIDLRRGKDGVFRPRGERDDDAERK